MTVHNRDTFAQKVDNSNEKFLGEESGRPTFQVACKASEFQRAASEVVSRSNRGAHWNDEVERVVSTVSSDEFVWFEVANNQRFQLVDEAKLKKLEEAMDARRWSDLCLELRGNSAGLEANVRTIVNTFANALKMSFPQAHLIPAKREIGNEGSKNDLRGGSLVNWLLEVQTPDIGSLEDQRLFERINTFLQSVTDKSDARIRIPHTKDHVLVEADGKTLPLASLGTGIHEVVLIAAHCTRISGEIVCIEEPEIHLHPVLQRKLIRYLKKETDNQYLIATHSVVSRSWWKFEGGVISG